MSAFAMVLSSLNANVVSGQDLGKYLDISPKALNTEYVYRIARILVSVHAISYLRYSQIEMIYLHGPDRTTPYEVTMKAVDELYKEGKFKRFGISNYMSYVGSLTISLYMPFISTTSRWEVAEIVGICKANGYIQPTAYQGIYNAIHQCEPCRTNY